MNTKTKIWVKIPCDTQVKKELTERFDQTCMFGFEDGEMQFPYEQVEVIIGEPDREEILAGKNIRCGQIYKKSGYYGEYHINQCIGGIWKNNSGICDRDDYFVIS